MEIIIIIILSILYIGIISFIAKAYYKNIQDLEERILVLEKRDADKIDRKTYNKKIDSLYELGQEPDISIETLLRRIEKIEKQKRIK